jgi:hypothetical protein
VLAASGLSRDAGPVCEVAQAGQCPAVVYAQQLPCHTADWRPVAHLCRSSAFGRAERLAALLWLLPLVPVVVRTLLAVDQADVRHMAG